jgi:hypothetical protein
MDAGMIRSSKLLMVFRLFSIEVVGLPAQFFSLRCWQTQSWLTVLVLPEGILKEKPC